MEKKYGPYKPYVRKKLLLDIPLELHKQLKMVAAQEDNTVTGLITKTLVKLIVDWYVKGKHDQLT